MLIKKVKISPPDPFVFEPSQTWDGNDGSWSTFIIRVGTPAQPFRVIISTASYETLVPDIQGCTTQDPADCGSLRGVIPFNGANSNGFQTTNSSTWEQIGLYNLLLEGRLNITGTAQYGFDTVGLHLPNSGGFTLKGQVVGSFATKSFYLGIFGLGVKPSNFSGYENHPQQAFLKNLRDGNLIPSLSFAYTAGASYRYQKIPASLTLGGYDASRFSRTNVTIPFGPDDSRLFTVGLQCIEATNTPNGNMTLTNYGMLSLIDSTTPHIWLPRYVCDQFQRALGLKYDNRTDLYWVNDTMHSRLKELNPSFTFRIGTEAQPSDSSLAAIDITLPYSAFDLQVTYPIYSEPAHYFPIRRAHNEGQYTLGRTFLQEAYLIADYERSTFSVHQAVFKSPQPPQDIHMIRSVNETVEHTEGESALSSGVIASVAVSSTVAVLLLVFLSAIYLRRRRRRRQAADAAKADNNINGRDSKVRGDGKRIEELQSEEIHEMAARRGIHELQIDEGFVELESSHSEGIIGGLPGSQPAGSGLHELEASTPLIAERTEQNHRPV